MAAFKNKDNGTWYVQFRYTDWKGERQQKLKRGFATKREALEWEREFLMEKQADVNMTFESFVALYEKDIKPKLKLKPAASPLPGELTESFSTRNSMVQDLRQKGRRNNYGSVQK